MVNENTNIARQVDVVIYFMKETLLKRQFLFLFSFKLVVSRPCIDLDIDSAIFCNI